MNTKEAIEWAGGTQKKLAEALGIAQPTVSGWGDYPPDEHQLRIQILSAGRLVAEPDVINPKRQAA